MPTTRASSAGSPRTSESTSPSPISAALNVPSFGPPRPRSNRVGALDPTTASASCKGICRMSAGRFVATANQSSVMGQTGPGTNWPMNDESRAESLGRTRRGLVLLCTAHGLVQPEPVVEDAVTRGQRGKRFPSDAARAFGGRSAVAADDGSVGKMSEARRRRGVPSPSRPNPHRWSASV